MPKPKPAKRPQTPDEFLRGAGFRIHARPAGREAVWERGGRLFRQTEAYDVANDEMLAALTAIEEKWG
jgi:hypothetical protein